VKKIKDLLFLPMRIAGRITVGAVGFVLMGGGLFLMDPMGLAIAGIPLFLVGFVLLLKAIF